MYKRIIIFWLLSSMLGYSVAWAFDIYQEAPITHLSVADNLTQTDDDSGNNDYCNHLCHGVAHLVGFCITTVVFSVPTTARLPITYLSTWISFLDSPPTTPPKV